MSQVVCQYRNVLGPEENRRLYDYAIAQEAAYRATGPETNAAAFPDWRRSRVMDGAHAGFARRIQAEVRQRFPDVLRALGMDPGQQLRAIELQLTSHNDGEHYRIHSDNGNAATASRIGTFVYYFHREPKAFSGGDLLVYGRCGCRDPRQPGAPLERIEPENDLLILFDPHRLHEVTDVSCPTKDFADGRFTLNGWIRG